MTSAPKAELAASEHDAFRASDDAIVQSIYRAGAGLEPWSVPLMHIVASYDAWAMHLMRVDKHSGHLMFSFEVGAAPPEAGIDLIRTYHRIDPRFALLSSWPTGKWLACNEHFDDEFVATNPFYQDFLIPHGGRYIFAAKLMEDDDSVVVLAHHRGNHQLPLDADGRARMERMGEHFAQAFAIQRHLNNVVERNVLGYALLDRLRQPVLLLDSERTITFCSKAARAILDRGDVLYDHAGMLACRNAESDIDFTLAMRELALAPFNPNAVEGRRVERRSIRLRRRQSTQIVAGTLLALRPTSVMGAFGQAPQALLTIYEPGASEEIDPFLLSTTFDLTPAEARVAAKVARGLSPEAIARELGVSISTVRTQLKATFDKTGTRGQADLVRLVLTAIAL